MRAVSGRNRADAPLRIAAAPLLHAASLFLLVYLGTALYFLSAYTTIALVSLPAAMIEVQVSCRGHLLGAPPPPAP